MSLVLSEALAPGKDVSLATSFLPSQPSTLLMTFFQADWAAATTHPTERQLTGHALPRVLLLHKLSVLFCSNISRDGFSSKRAWRSHKNPGSDYYLGCGDDTKCSMMPLVGVQEHDGWTAVEISGLSWQLLIRVGSWALDVRDITQIFS